MCLPVLLKEGSRVRLCKILVAIEACCVILAKLLSHHGFRYRKDFRLYTSLVEGYDAGALPLLLIATGVLTSLANLYGIYVAFRSMYPSLRHRTVSQMSIYIKVVLVVVVLLLICCFFCFLQQELIDDTFKNGIMSALKRYRTDAKVKEDIDQLQLRFMCCGNEKYSDWFQVNWISQEYVDVNLSEEQKKMRNGVYETDDVPFSCCNPDANRPCINRNVHDNLKNFNYVYQKDLTIFKDGCRPVLVQKADYLVAFIFCVVLLLIFLELSIGVLIRHFVTSVENALELGDPTATTYGYLFRFMLFISPDNTAEDKEEYRSNHNSGPASSATASAASSSITLPPPPPPPSPPAIPLPPQRDRPLPSVPPRPPQSLSQTGRRPSRRPSYQMGAPSPTRPEVTTDQTTVDMNVERPFPGATFPITQPGLPYYYSHPTVATSAVDGYFSQQPDPGVNRSPSFYDQFSRRMSRPSAWEPQANPEGGRPNDRPRT